MSDPYPWQRSSSGGGYNAGRYYSNYYIVSKDRAAGSAATPDPPHPTKLTAPVYWELLATWCGEVRRVRDAWHTTATPRLTSKKCLRELCQSGRKRASSYARLWCVGAGGPLYPEPLTR